MNPWDDDQIALLDRFTTVGLEELERVASLQTRVDRKYLLPTHGSHELLSALHRDVAVLRIDGACTFRYDTVYFDTPSLDSYLSTARRRRQRFKVRIRTYVDGGIAMLEVKRKGGRGETVKVRTRHPVESGAILTPASAAFVDDALGQRGVAERLRPSLVTSFARMTLLDRLDGSRATLDRDVSFWSRADRRGDQVSTASLSSSGEALLDERCGQTVRLFAPVPDVPGGEAVVLRDHAILETKSVGAATEADRWLWSHGHRPTSFSKYCIGMALNHADLPANRWNRTLRRDLGWRPQRDLPVGQTVANPRGEVPQRVPAMSQG